MQSILYSKNKMLHAANSQELQTSRTYNYTYIYNFLTVVSGFIFVFYVHMGNTGGLQTKTSYLLEVSL